MCIQTCGKGSQPLLWANLWAASGKTALNGMPNRINRRYLESFEMWRWGRMEKISWTDRVRNEEVLHRVKEERNIIHTVKRRKANWIGHMLRRNCFLAHVIEGKIEEGM